MKSKNIIQATLLLTLFSVVSLSQTPVERSLDTCDRAVDKGCNRNIFIGDLAPVPFKGTLHGNDTDLGFTDTTVTVQTVGTGKGTALGRFSFTQVVTVDVTNGTNAGVAHWVAANGDSISMTSTGSFEQTSTPGVGLVTEVYTITGGTGRFAGAQGSFIVERLITEATGDTSGSFHGTITSPGSAR